jgi:hypothetical protein
VVLASARVTRQLGVSVALDRSLLSSGRRCWVTANSTSPIFLSRSQMTVRATAYAFCVHTAGRPSVMLAVLRMVVLVEVVLVSGRVGGWLTGWLAGWLAGWLLALLWWWW